MLDRIKVHFSARLPEWFNSVLLITWGMYVLMHPTMFEHPVVGQLFIGLVHMADGVGFPAAWFWGGAAFVIGLARVTALYINGTWNRTPMVRLLASAASAFLWAQVLIGLLDSGIPNVGIPVYSWLVILDLVSGYRAGIDVAIAEKARRENKIADRSHADDSASLAGRSVA